MLDENDESWLLMVVFMHQMGVVRRRTQEMSAGPELLEAFDSGVLTVKKVDDAMIEHLTRLKDAAVTEAAAAGVETVSLNVGHPNFSSRTRGRTRFAGSSPRSHACCALPSGPSCRSGSAARDRRFRPTGANSPLIPAAPRSFDGCTSGSGPSAVTVV